MLRCRRHVASTSRYLQSAVVIAASRSSWESGAGSGSYAHSPHPHHHPHEPHSPQHGSSGYSHQPPHYAQHSHQQYPTQPPPQYSSPSPPCHAAASHPAPHIDVRQMHHATASSASGSARPAYTWREFLRRVIVGGIGWGALFTVLALGASPVSAMAHVKQRGDWPFILAEGAMWDPMFRDSLVLIFDCGPLSGAQGIVVNKPAMGPLPATAAAAGAGDGEASDAAPVPPAAAGPGSGPTLRGENLPTGQSWLVSQELARNPVFIGGPLALDAAEPLIVHGVPDVAGSHEALPGLFVGGDHRVLRRKVLAGACAPDEMLLVIGFSSWRLGQLQREIRKGTWQSGAIVAPTVIQDPRDSSQEKVGADTTANVRVRQLLRAMNAAAVSGVSPTEDGETVPRRIHRAALERGLATMVTDRFMDAARVIPVPPATKATLSDENKAKVGAIEPMPTPPAADADDAAHAEFSEKRAAWMKQNINLSNIPNDSVHGSVKKTLTTAHSPLFGYVQRNVASRVNGDTVECLAGYAAKCPVENMRPLHFDDYVPVISAASLPSLAVGGDSGRRES